ncbi:MAG TPA: HlyC/CorC family transporter, partial [Microbacteriaceae bacterium]|nr:HlyC/CorC family transporter [Microbacteriaceae bacterium]
MGVVFVLVALVLIGVGGLLTAINAALGVLGRNDLLEEASSMRNPQPLHRVAADITA